MVRASTLVPEALGSTRRLELVEPTLQHVHQAFDRSVAFVVGINAYGAGIPTLKTAVPDAEAIGALLEGEHSFTKILLTNREATGDRIRSALGSGLRHELGTELRERDRLLVYFAGHGLSVPSEYGPEGQLLLADADPGDPSTYFAMSELRRLLSALPCRHVLVVLDCCFAGTFRWAGNRVDRQVSARAYRETLDRFVKHRAWQVLVSASHDQTALDAMPPPPTAGPLASGVVSALGASRVETESHSPFAAALLRALRGAADYTKDGLIVAAEIELFVRDAVEHATGVRQTPQLYKLEQHDRGEFVFQVPGTALALGPAPALSPETCPYQGLQPFSSAERGRFFGRAGAVTELVGRVKANPLTVILGLSGSGKSSLLAAGLVPALRETPDWTVIEARPDATPAETLRDLIDVPAGGGIDPGRTLLERVTAWLSVHVSRQLCLAIDQAEGLELLAPADARDRVLGGLAQALEAHDTRLRVVLTLRSEFDPVFRASALAPLWDDAVYVVPVLAHHELREIIEQPARPLELSFEPASLVDTLIDEVLQAPGGLPLLSFALRELHARCAERNTDRLLTQSDYARMGRLSGALAQRASALLRELVAQDPAYQATARRVFLRMVVQRDGEWSRRRAHRDEFVYADSGETQRATTLLTRFRDARLLVFDKDEWEPAHDWLVRGWPMFSMWRTQCGAKTLALQFELGEAAKRWHEQRRVADLWSLDVRLLDARMAMRAPEPWLNARERAFVAASQGRRRLRVYLAAASIALTAIAGLIAWDLYYRPHVAYYRDYVRRWGEPEGIDALTPHEAQGRATSVKLVQHGHWGHVVHIELVRSREELAHANTNGIGTPELGVGQKAAGERMPCQWDFAYESDTDTVSAEVAEDRAGRVLYRLQYLSGPKDRRTAEFLDENGYAARVTRGDAELVEFIRSTEGRDREKRYKLRYGEPATNQDGISIEELEYDEQGHLVLAKFFDQRAKPTRRKDGVAGYRSTFDPRGNQTEVAYFDETGKPTRRKDGVAGYRSTFDPRGNQTEVAYFDEAGKPTRLNDGYAGVRSTFDPRGNQTEVAYFDETGKPTRRKDGYAGVRSTFDPRGNETEVAYFDEAGKPTRINHGYAGYRSTFDPRGNQTEVAYFDEVGKPTRRKDGVAGYRSTFDPRGNQTEVVYFDEAGKPTRLKDGYAGYRSTFDPRGNQTEVVFFDEAGKPTRSKDGHAGYRSTFDPRGNQTEVAYLDESGEPLQLRNGVAVIRTKYDERGDVLETTAVNLAGHSVALPPAGD